MENIFTPTAVTCQRVQGKGTKHAMIPLHVNILAWVGYEEKAAAIEKAVTPHADKVSVIYSVPDDAPEVPQSWITVDYECFFGCKFARAISHHTEGLLLQIQADAHVADWGHLISRCREAFEAHPDLGVWGPNIDYTIFPTEKVIVSDFDPKNSLVAVRQTDGIVWAMSNRVVERMRQADYSGNRLGWGIDSMAIAFAYANNMLVLRDTSITVDHPRGQGYGQEEATSQFEKFMEQLTPQEQIQLKVTRVRKTSPTTKDLLYMLGRRLVGKETA